jgi:hypothetical protein
MCRLLAELTNTNERMMRETIRRLELRCGEPAVDIRLTADIHSQIHQKVRALGLDPHDTHTKELYASLLNLASVHDGFLKKKFGIGSNIEINDFSSSVEKIYSRLRFNRRTWALKSASIKKLLLSNPPKQTAKQLGYKSIDSMLKRENSDVVLLAASRLESKTWQNKLDTSISKLASAHFEDKTVEVVTLGSEKNREFAELLALKHRNLVFSTPLTATVLVLNPLLTVRPGMTLLAVLMAIKEASSLQYTHTHLKHQQMQSNFGQELINSFRHLNRKSVSVAGHPFSWDIIHRHYGSQDSANHPTVLQPHLEVEDMAYRRAEEVLFRAEPALQFWHLSDYVGLKAGSNIISFNLLDVLINLVNRVDFSVGHSGHMVQAIWDELMLRYMQSKTIEDTVINQMAFQNINEMVLSSGEFI